MNTSENLGGASPLIEEAASMTAYEKAMVTGEPVFVLRGQDISAPLVVEFWAAVQQTIRDLMDAGATMSEAVESARAYHKIPRLTHLGESLIAKERGAVAIARAMLRWHNRKVAD